MKSFSLTTALLIFCFFPVITKAQNQFGLGIILGGPTGVSAKYNLSKTNALDAALAFSGSSRFYLHGTYLQMMPRAFVIDRYPVNWYLGVGARLIDHNHHHDNHHHWWRDHDDHDHRSELHFGVRAPIGLQMMFRDPRIELFTELALAMDLVPTTSVDVGLGIGARYYF